MTEAARILKGYRNHRNLEDLYDSEGEVIVKGAKTVATELSEAEGIPIHVNEQTAKTITTSDGRVRKTFQGFYLSLSKGEQTIFSAIPEGYVEPEVEDTGRIAKETRERIALVAKQALADAVDDLIAELGEDHDERVRGMVAAWAKRIPGEGWDLRLGPDPSEA